MMDKRFRAPILIPGEHDAIILDVTARLRPSPETIIGVEIDEARVLRDPYEILSPGDDLPPLLVDAYRAYLHKQILRAYFNERV